jgi:hypothetical protein
VSYVEKHLIEGETVAYETRLHWIVLIGPILLGAAFVLMGVMLLLYSGTSGGSMNGSSTVMRFGGAILAFIGGILIIRGFLNRNATEMAVTNRRVVIKVGLAARRTVEMLLSRVESIGVEESVMGRMLGYGTVIVRGTGGTPESFDKIARPLEFRTQVQQQIEKAK